MRRNLKEVEFLFYQQQRLWAKDWIDNDLKVRSFCLESQGIMVRRGGRGSWEELEDLPVYETMRELLSPYDRLKLQKIWNACLKEGASPK